MAQSRPQALFSRFLGSLSFVSEYKKTFWVSNIIRFQANLMIRTPDDKLSRLCRNVELTVVSCGEWGGLISFIISSSYFILVGRKFLYFIWYWRNWVRLSIYVDSCWAYVHSILLCIRFSFCIRPGKRFYIISDTLLLGRVRWDFFRLREL